MKNIHILTTSKLSRLIKDIWKKTFSLVENFNTNHTDFKAHHIYITSNEEIKEGDWILVPSTDGETYFDFRESVPKKAKCNYASNKFVFKIILTTDQDLIKDGVQAIDDEFLEWFVKNPSCESVEVRKIGKEWTYNAEVPKEEPNPFELPKTLSDDVFYESLEPKQETIEEVAERFSNTYAGDEVAPAYEGFIDGAKWQQERMLKFILDEDNYTEEELESSCIDVQTLVHFIEQFKKK